MPYIKQKDRDRFFSDDHQKLDALVARKCFTVGDLNYIVTSICHRYIEERGLSYKVINDIIGVLECAKLEMYRRTAAPYEDEKIDVNGDVT